MHEHEQQRDDDGPDRAGQGLVEDASTPGQPPVSSDTVGTGGPDPGQEDPEERQGGRSGGTGS